MDSKALKNILSQALTFLIIFLIVNFVYNQFFNKAEPLKTGIQFYVSQKQISQNDLVTAHLENYTDQNLVIKNSCPEPSILVEKLENGEWTPQSTRADIDCSNQNDLIIKPGEKLPYNFKSWNHDLFGQLGTYRLKVLAGDKTLESNQFEIVNMSFFGWIWTTLIHQPIYNALVFFASILPGNDLGLAIILLTILIRTILLIPNQKALKSQKKLQNIQPKLAELKEKHGHDQQRMAQETLSLYKEHKVNPFGSCLPILIQLPILIGLFNVIQSGMDPGSKYLLYGPLQGFDLNSVQTVFLGVLDLTKVDILFLPITVGLLQYLQLKMSMGRKKNTQPASEMEVANRTMTVIMPLMVAFFTASVPSGVGLYWAFSTIYGIIQQTVVNRSHDRESTQIKVKASSNKEKKKQYQEINKQRKTSKETTEKPEEKEDQNDDNNTPPITVIKV